jgi:hypothetical protein
VPAPQQAVQLQRASKPLVPLQLGPMPRLLLEVAVGLLPHLLAVQV